MSENLQFCGNEKLNMSICTSDINEPNEEISSSSINNLLSEGLVLPEIDNKNLIRLNDEHLSETEKSLINGLVKEFQPAFAKSKSDIGTYQLFDVNMQLDLT